MNFSNYYGIMVLSDSMAHQSTGEGSRNSLGNRESPERSRDKLHCILRQWLARRVLRSGLEFEVSGARFGVGPCKTDELFRAAKATVARDIGEAIAQCPVMELAAVLDILASSSDSLKASTELDAKYHIRFNPQQLKIEGETRYQKTFNDENKSCAYIFSAAYTNGHIPVPKYNYDRVYVFSGKPDNVNIVRPWFIEFKAGSHEEVHERCNDAPMVEDWAVIEQCIDRVCCVATLNAHLSQVGAFGVTCRRLWVVFFRRRVIEDGVKVPALGECVHIMRTDPAHLSQLWALLTYEAEMNRNLIFTDPAVSAYITTFLNRISLIHGYCRCSLVGASSSMVYSLSFPGIYKTADTASVIGIDGYRKQVSIKIITGRDEFEQERQCVRQVSAFLGLHDPDAARDFYVAGTWQYGEDVYEPSSAQWAMFFESVNVNAIKVLSNTVRTRSASAHQLDPWWSYTPTPPSAADRGGIVIMRCADVTAIPHADLPGLTKAAMLWLHRIHAARVLHCDLQIQNILYFHPLDNVKRRSSGSYTFTTFVNNALLQKLSAGWQIVDFGLGCACGTDGTNDRNFSSESATALRSKVWIRKDSSQYRNGGPGLHKAGAAFGSVGWFEYDWSVEDDWAMLFQAMINVANRICPFKPATSEGTDLDHVFVCFLMIMLDLVKVRKDTTFEMF
jgi:hypothetical protein